VPDSKCLDDKPPTSRACNLNLCVDWKLSLLSPASSALFQAGSEIEITWQGGTLYGQVSIQVQQVRIGISGLTLDDSKLAWTQSEYGLPDFVNNTGSFNWTIPSDIPSGRYLLRVVSGSDESNQAVLQDPLRIQATKQYSLMAIPTFPGSFGSVGTFASLNVVMVGALGNASLDTDTDTIAGPSINKGKGVKAWSMRALDIGEILSLEYREEFLLECFLGSSVEKWGIDEDSPSV
ncbi:hypothetical protein DUNSADRAFT_801, partial [Dunaliella salina]